MDRDMKTMLRLYVAGEAHNSVLALANLTAMCREFLPSQPDIEVINVFQHPKRALAEGIFMTPMLVRISPLPAVQIVGTLSESRIVLLTLGLMPSSEIVDETRERVRYRAGGQPGRLSGDE